MAPHSAVLVVIALAVLSVRRVSAHSASAQTAEAQPTETIADFDKGNARGGGDCMYDSLIQAARSNGNLKKFHEFNGSPMDREKQIRMVRRKIANHLRDNFDEFKDFFGSGASVEEQGQTRDLKSFIENTRNSKEWGNELCLRAFATIYNVTVQIYGNDENEPRPFKVPTSLT
eukprot:GHVN01010276.1.p1 GENE.GHVN01010276.1~~GHVN01010276.1.p1  ORF type:complete len:173 (-),score=23.89 GHVN01010276.1:102-620(-)